ncbi:hypothetical protein AgCh_034052 [Apium graveolens]
MGRAKLTMELIKKEKLRSSTFQQRKINLKKKVHELATLCGIKAVVIIHGPHPLESEIWPQNRDEVLELFDKYKVQPPENRKKRTSLVSDFFKERVQKAQQALTKQRKDNVQSKYPTTHSRFNSMKEEDLRKTVFFLENALVSAKAKMKQMKANNIYRAHQQQVQQQHMILSKKRKMEFDAENQANKYLKIEPYQAILDPVQVPILMPCPIYQQRIPCVGHKWNQMMGKFGNEYVGGASNIVHNAPLSKDVYNYPAMSGTLDSIGYVHNSAWAPPNYYYEGRQPIAQPVMEYRPMVEGLNHHQMVAASRQYYENRKWQR